jgi:uncharacterized protein (DUF362 family)
MNRREFCTKLIASGGVLVAAPLLKACADPSVETTMPIIRPTSASQLLATPSPFSATVTPQSTTYHEIQEEIAALKETPETVPNQPALVAETQEKATIALVKTTDRIYGINKCIELLNINPVNGQRVLLKPNFNSADPFPGSTHPTTLRALASQVNDLGARSLTVADRSGMGNTNKVMQQLGVFDLADEFGFETVVLEELEDKEWEIRSDSDFHWSAGFPVPRMLLDNECIIQTCNLKTHRYGGHFTMSLKNSVGLVAKNIQSSGHDFMRELHDSPHQRDMIAEINTSYKPSLIIMDGVEAFVTGGPAQGRKVQSEVVLAGTDPVAMDAVGVAILRLFGTTQEVERGAIFEQEQIARAAELGLGISAPDEIDIITGDPDSEAYATRILELLLI